MPRIFSGMTYTKDCEGKRCGSGCGSPSARECTSRQPRGGGSPEGGCPPLHLPKISARAVQQGGTPPPGDAREAGTCSNRAPPLSLCPRRGHGRPAPFGGGRDPSLTGRQRRHFPKNAAPPLPCLRFKIRFPSRRNRRRRPCACAAKRRQLLPCCPPVPIGSPRGDPTRKEEGGSAAFGRPADLAIAYRLPIQAYAMGNKKQNCGGSKAVARRASGSPRGSGTLSGTRKAGLLTAPRRGGGQVVNGGRAAKLPPLRGGGHCVPAL